MLINDVTVDRYLPLEMSQGAYSTKDEISAHGFPAYNVGDQLQTLEGKISAASRINGVKRILVNTLLNQGISGGPLIDSRSKVIGVLQKGGPTENRQMATGIEELRRLLSNPDS